jgi:hypothetical protein
MRNSILHKIKSKKGAALAFVLVALVFVFIMISIVATFSQANIKQAGAQESDIKAFYIARSGVELAYQVLMKKGLVAQYEAGTLTGDLVENDIDFEEGTANVTVSPFVDENDLKKIRITSVGTLNGSTNSSTVSLEFFANYKDYPEMKWTY